MCGLRARRASNSGPKAWGSRERARIREEREIGPSARHHVEAVARPRREELSERHTCAEKPQLSPSNGLGISIGGWCKPIRSDRHNPGCVHASSRGRLDRVGSSARALAYADRCSAAQKLDSTRSGVSAREAEFSGLGSASCASLTFHLLLALLSPPPSRQAANLRAQRRSA